MRVFVVATQELGVPFLKISAPEVVSGMSGESEAKIRELFDQALEMAPCIVFIDEIDAITPKRESAQREMERRIVAQLLTSMDDLSVVSGEGKPVVVIGATNRPEALVCVHWPMACVGSKIAAVPLALVSRSGSSSAAGGSV
jgi:SpoVK/Ycf46/Vps4 family AAA+-type ATPase